MNRRLPNPWIAVPSLVMGLLAGALGWTVTYVSCGTTTGCTVWAVGVALISFLAALLGTGLLLILVYRSIAEWREAEEKNTKAPGPGCETPESGSDPA